MLLSLILCISSFWDHKLADLYDGLAISYISFFSVLCWGCGVVKIVKTSKDTGIEFMWTLLCVIQSLPCQDGQRTATLTYTFNWL